MSEKGCAYSESTPILGGKTTTGLLQLKNGDISNKDQCECTTGMSDNNSKHCDKTTDVPVHIEELELDENKGFKFSKIPRDKKIVLCLCAFANVLAAAAYTILTPFFPMAAEQKGLNQAMIGFVFGLYQLVIFLTSPFMGNCMIYIGAKFMFLSGIFIGGCSAILFGLLDKGPDGTIFLVMCILIRSVEALGFAAFMTASMTIVSSEFQDHVSSVVAILKIAMGFGGLIGPLLGGVLYDIGGFGLPFFSIAAATLLNGLFIYNFLPHLQSEKSKQKREKSILDLMRSPLVVIPMISVFVGLCSIHFYLSTFSLFMQPFGLSTSLVGAMFSIASITHICMSPFWAYIVDIKDKQSILIISSHLMSCFGWWLLGHSPLLPIEPFTLWSIGVGLFIVGVFLGCLTIAPIKCMLYGALELKYEKDPDTFAMVSGLYNSVYALGSAVGPLVGGAFVQRYGYPYMFTGFGCLNLIMFLVNIGFFSFRYSNIRKDI